VLHLDTLGLTISTQACSRAQLAYSKRLLVCHRITRSLVAPAVRPTTLLQKCLVRKALDCVSIPGIFQNTFSGRLRARCRCTKRRRTDNPWRQSITTSYMVVLKTVTGR
jgi:hypothetical protein